MKGSVFSQEPIVALDIGTTKICVLVAQETADGSIEVIGIGKSTSHGLKKGIVVDINKTIHSIKRAVQEAELMAGCKIESACIGISGSHVQSINSQGVVPIKRKEVTQVDIKNVLASAQAVALPEGQQILHVLPQYYVIDSHERVKDPLGMYGVRLEAQVHIITGALSCVQNLVKCCESLNIKVTDIVLEQLASALAVLSPDERQLGVGVLDIGGGTSDFALYHNNSIIYTMVLPVAGDHFSNDLALGLRITLEDAERVKQVGGFVNPQGFEQDGMIEVESVQGGIHKNILLSELCAILQPRASELFNLINQELEQRKLKQFLSAGIVLTGGGSLLEGMQELATEIFGVPVRIGKPKSKDNLLESLDNPKYATGYGLLLHELQERSKKVRGHFSGPLVMRIAARMKSWVSDFF
jgi:cell division protein FtsA